MPHVSHDSRESLVQRLERAVAREHVVTEPDLLPRYEQDWTGRWHGDALCAVRPGSTGEVVAVLEACTEAGVPVVAQGGNTGLVGGAVPQDGAVVLSTERLAELGTADPITGRVLVGAGTTLADVAAAAEEAGWAVGVDLASRETATIGGMVATDAGGSRVVAHGPMRAHVAGLEAVLADGTVIRPWLEGLPKDTAGYDLRQVLVGSEGTLGVVTRVLLQLVRPSPTTATLLLGADAGDLADLVADVRAEVSASTARLTACEFMTRDGAALVADALGRSSPVEADVGLLVDLAGEVPDDLLAALDTLSSTDAVVGLDDRTRAQLWRLREGHTEAVATLGTPVKLDVAVPLSELAGFLDAVRATVATVGPSATCVLFGHAAEGNVHVNVVGVDEHVDRLEEAVYTLVADAGGTVSAEHGIGRAKVDHLARTRDAGTIAAMRRIKSALDPGDLLNPGVVLPTGGR